MNNLTRSTIENKLSEFYAVDPNGDFVKRLEKELLAQKRLPLKPAVRPTRASGLPRWVWAGAVVLILAALMFATPQGRALAQEVVRFFTRTFSDILPYSPKPLNWVDLTPSAPPSTPTPLAAFAADCGDFDDPKCSVAEIRARVSFPVEELGVIPEGMRFIGATGGPEYVEIVYSNDQYAWAAVLLEGPWTDHLPIAQWQIGPSAVVQTVQIDGASGEYVKGGFLVAPGGKSQVWSVDAGEQTLHWVKDGIFYSLEEVGPAAILDQSALVALAGSLTTKPVAASRTPIPATATPAPTPVTYHGILYDLSLEQASQQAGFKVAEPRRLPDLFAFAGAAYRPDDHIVRAFYVDRTVNHLPNQYGLTISEQLVTDPASCQLCGILFGDYGDPVQSKKGMLVGASASIETVKIGAITGQYVEGYWMPTGGFHTWVSTPMVKTLRWQTGSLAFEIQYSGYSVGYNVPIGKADLIAIAEDMLK